MKKENFDDKPLNKGSDNKKPIGGKDSFFSFSFNQKLFTKELNQQLSPISDFITRIYDKKELLTVALLGEQKLHSTTSNRDLRQSLTVDNLFKNFIISVNGRNYVPFMFVLTISFIIICIDYDLRSQYETFLMNSNGYVQPKFYNQLSNIIRKTVSRGCTVTPCISNQFRNWIENNSLHDTIWDVEYLRNNTSIRLSLFGKLIDKSCFESYGVEYDVASLGKFQLNDVSLLSSLDSRIDFSTNEIQLSADDSNTFPKENGIIMIDKKQAAYGVLLTPKLFDVFSNINRSVPLGIGTVYTVVTSSMVLDVLQSFITYGNPGKQKKDSDIGGSYDLLEQDEIGVLGKYKFSRRAGLITRTINRLLDLGLTKDVIKYVDVLHQLMSRPG